MCCCLFFFFKQKTSYEIRISGWSSEVCSADLLLDDLGRDGLGSEAEARLEGECQVHLDLERGAQALGDEVDRVLVHQVGNLDPPGRTGAGQPGNIVAAFGADALIVEGGRAVADLFHLRADRKSVG